MHIRQIILIIDTWLSNYTTNKPMTSGARKMSRPYRICKAIIIIKFDW